MQTIEIKTLTAFIGETEKFDSLFSEIVLFRGQDKQGGLLPGIARKSNKNDTEKLERKLLQQLRLVGSALIPNGMSDLDLMVIAQHFGLKTRLLDWTSNPLAAMYFACASYDEGDVFVYALDADSFLEVDVHDKDPFSGTATRAFQPKLNNRRIVAQQGWFTLHRYSRRGGRFVPLEQNGNAMKLLTEYKVPSGRRRAMLESLDRHGVNASSVYPDLGGLCSHMNWKHGAV